MLNRGLRQELIRGPPKVGQKWGIAVKLTGCEVTLARAAN